MTGRRGENNALIPLRHGAPVAGDRTFVVQIMAPVRRQWHGGNASAKGIGRWFEQELKGRQPVLPGRLLPKQVEMDRPAMLMAQD